MSVAVPTLSLFTVAQIHPTRPVTFPRSRLLPSATCLRTFAPWIPGAPRCLQCCRRWRCGRCCRFVTWLSIALSVLTVTSGTFEGVRHCSVPTFAFALAALSSRSTGLRAFIPRAPLAPGWHCGCRCRLRCRLTYMLVATSALRLDSLTWRIWH